MISVCLAAALCGCGRTETFFQNPVIREDLADPSIIRVGNTYYATGSSYNWEPEYPIYRSEDMVNWQQVGNIFDTRPEWTSRGFWAPELFEHNGKIYCFYSAGRKSDGKHCIGVAVADSPEGPYTDLGCSIDSGTEQIDSYVFNDNGTLYISWKAHGLDNCPIEIACSRLSDDCMRLEGEPFVIVRDDERIGMEGQCMFKRGSRYYLLYSAKACCGPGSDYEVRVARAESIEGPWEKCPDNPILSGDTEEVQSIGHGSVVETPDGRLFYLSHAYLGGDAFNLGRRPFLSQLETTDDGWICCVTGPKAAINQKTPFTGTIQKIDKVFEANFASSVPGPAWTHPDIGIDGINVLCRRPVSTVYDVVAEVTGRNGSGLIFLGNNSAYVSFTVEGNPSEIIVRSVIGDRTETLASWPAPDGSITMTAYVTGCVSVTFGWNAGGAQDSFALPVGLSPLMQWDSTFRPGVCTRADSFDGEIAGFTMKAL